MVKKLKNKIQRAKTSFKELKTKKNKQSKRVNENKS